MEARLWRVAMDATRHHPTSNADEPPHQAGRRGGARRAPDELAVQLDLPELLPITDQEVALIARYLSGVIAAILDELE